MLAQRKQFVKYQRTLFTIKHTKGIKSNLKALLIIKKG